MRKKADRNKELVEKHNEFPTVSYSELGRYFGISKQRVCRILRDNSKKRQDKHLAGFLSRARDWVKSRLTKPSD